VKTLSRVTVPARRAAFHKFCYLNAATVGRQHEKQLIDPANAGRITEGRYPFLAEVLKQDPRGYVTGIARDSQG
jgi:hypothetical protein